MENIKLISTYRKSSLFGIILVIISIYTTGCKKEVEQPLKLYPTISWQYPEDISYGTLLSEIQLNAKTNVSGTFVYTPPLGTKLELGLNQELRVDFTPEDNSKYNPVKQIVKINVKIGPEITWNNPSIMLHDEELGDAQLNATANIPGSFVYTPPKGTRLKGGVNDLRVEFTPSDTYTYCKFSKTVQINVIVRKSPVINWSNPVDIFYGSLLSETQLNAFSDIPGSLVYNPPIGTKLSPGTNIILKVDFIPSDTMTYYPISKTVKINVFWDDIIFNPNLIYGTMTDQDGNIYKTITIGTQTWMAENLRTTKYRNGDPIPNITDWVTWFWNTTTGAYCWYNNDEACHKTTLGALYNKFAVIDSRNIAPLGWHVATNEEWTALISHIGGEGSALGKLRETGILHWESPNTNATNESGFTALPSGKREYFESVEFHNIHTAVYFWTSTVPEINHLNFVILAPSLTSGIIRGAVDNDDGFSVRCVKDN